VPLSKIDMKRHVHTPDDAVGRALRLIQKRLDDPRSGIKQNIPGTGDILAPWFAGELVVIVGYTSNGKSSLANYMVTQHAYALRSHQRDNPDYKHVIVYATWEQTIEEQTILDLGRVTAIPTSKILKGELTKDEIDRIWDQGAKDRRSLPVWLIGSSIEDDRSRLRFSMDEISTALAHIESMDINIDMIVLDYLQRIRRVSNSSEMREGFMGVVDAAKDMAIRCPVILLSQAGRQVRSRSWQLPDLDDAQETSNTEQSAQHYYSVWMPKQTGRPTIVVNDLEYKITDNLLVLGILKQTMGPAPVLKVYNIGFGGTYLEEAQGFAPSGDGSKKRTQR